MQPDLPWNVAGIPAEAREAARASARREGLSVGEWLTRRILATFAATGGENFEADARAWRAETAAAQAASRDTEDMLAHVSRSESETQNAYRRIEEQLRVLGRRLDQTERSQSESSRAMGKAATEISIASREQAQAFDQLGTHVVSLSERLKRVEQQTTNDSLRTAVKALHEGLTRLADQIATNANQSASQIAAVAGNVEAVAAKLAQARLETENATQALDGRASALDERVRRIEQSDGHTPALRQLSETLERLNSRFSILEAQNAGTIARIEETVARLESRFVDPANERRIQSVEHAVVDATARIDQLSKQDGTEDLRVSLRALTARLDEAEKRERELAAELKNMSRLPEPKIEPVIAPAPQFAPAAQFTPPPAMAPQPVMAATEMAQFDLPPFPEQAAPPFPPPDPYAVPPPPPFDSGFAQDNSFGGDQIANESYLAAARRSAREAAASQAEVRQGFSWGFAQKQHQPIAAKHSSMRYVLIGGIVLIALIALMAGMLLRGGHSTIQARNNIGALFNKSAQPAIKPAVAPLPQMAAPQTAAPQSVAPQTAAPQTAAPKAQTTVASKPAATSEGPAKRLAVAPVAQKTARPAPAKATASLTPQQHLTQLASAGNATAELLLGLNYLDGSGVAANEAEAARWFERSANQGNPIAQYRLGTLYERGRGVHADAAKAVQLYQAAAKAGNRKAMHNLAVAYAQGSGVQKDYNLAAQWFLKAADLGLSDSQFNLAVLYERGMGVPQSLLDAYKWYAVAAAHGDTESKSRIDALATQLSPDDRAAAQRSADSFKPVPMNAAANVPPDIASLPPA